MSRLVECLQFLRHEIQPRNCAITVRLFDDLNLVPDVQLYVFQQRRSTYQTLLDSYTHTLFYCHFDHLKSLHVSVVKAVKHTRLPMNQTLIPESYELLNGALVYINWTKFSRFLWLSDVHIHRYVETHQQEHQCTKQVRPHVACFIVDFKKRSEREPVCIVANAVASFNVWV